MIMDARIKVAAALLLGVLSLLGSAQAHAAATDMQYACDGGQRLIVHRHAGGVSVEFIDRTYELRSKRSSFDEKYISATAALIIDGPSAVFAAEDRLQLGQCLEAGPATASDEAASPRRASPPAPGIRETAYWRAARQGRR